METEKEACFYSFAEAVKYLDGLRIDAHNRLYPIKIVTDEGADDMAGFYAICKLFHIGKMLEYLPDCAMVSLDLSGCIGIRDFPIWLQNCSALASIKFGDTLEIIRPDAFRGCKNLAHISIPESVLCIGKNAFSREHIKKIEFEGKPCKWDSCVSIDDILFKKEEGGVRKEFRNIDSVLDEELMKVFCGNNWMRDELTMGKGQY